MSMIRPLTPRPELGPLLVAAPAEDDRVLRCDDGAEVGLHCVVPVGEEPVGLLRDAVEGQQLVRDDLAHVQHLRLTWTLPRGRLARPRLIGDPRDVVGARITGDGTSSVIGSQPSSRPTNAEQFPARASGSAKGRVRLHRHRRSGATGAAATISRGLQRPDLRERRGLDRRRSGDLAPFSCPQAVQAVVSGTAPSMNALVSGLHVT
jgi:hypothetical protein